MVEVVEEFTIRPGASLLGGLHRGERPLLLACNVVIWPINWTYNLRAEWRRRHFSPGTEWDLRSTSPKRQVLKRKLPWSIKRRS